MSNRAWVTLATNDSYGLGALVLAHSLRRAGSTYPAVVLITPSVTDAMRDRLRAVFAEVVIVDVLDSKDATHLALLQRPELGITFTKIHCWNLTQYEKCVFLDADTLIVQNCDELFEREELSAAPDVGWPDCFNSGVFVFKPSKETFDSLVKFAQERGSFDGGDQGLLNSYFSDWAHGDISKHLPFLYNVTSAAFYSYLPALKHYGQNLKIIHFIGTAKPWLQQFNWETRTAEAPQHLREFLQLWWDIFVGHVHCTLDTSMVELEEALPAVTPQETFFHAEPWLDYAHYEPILDPESEFPWHHPDAQIPDLDINVPEIDMTQYHDPWDIYRGHIPPYINDSTHSHIEFQNTENHEEVRRYAWDCTSPRPHQTDNSSNDQNIWHQEHSQPPQFEHIDHSHLDFRGNVCNYNPQYNYTKDEESSHNYFQHSPNYDSRQQDHTNQYTPHNYNQQEYIQDNTNHHTSSQYESSHNSRRDSLYNFSDISNKQNHSSSVHKYCSSDVDHNENVELSLQQDSVKAHFPIHTQQNRIEHVYYVQIDQEKAQKKIENYETELESKINGDGEMDNEIFENLRPRHPYDGFYLRHRMTIDSRGRKICTHEVPPTPTPSPPESPIPDIWDVQPSEKDEEINQPNGIDDQTGVAGNLARVVLGSGAQKEALDDLTRRQGWEAGNIDYMGADAFDNIWAKISQTLSQPRTSPPKQSTPPPQADIPPPGEARAPVSAAAPVATPAREKAPAVVDIPAPVVPTEAPVAAVPEPVVEAPVQAAKPQSPVPLEVPAETKVPEPAKPSGPVVERAPAPVVPPAAAPVSKVVAAVPKEPKVTAPAEVPAVAAPAGPVTPPATIPSEAVEAKTKAPEAAPAAPPKAASPVLAPVAAAAAPKTHVTPEKGASSTDSPPLANTPSKEEVPIVPAAKSEERRKPGKLQLPAAATDPLPTPDSELEDAAALAHAIIAGELRTPTVTAPSPSADTACPATPLDARRLSVDEPEMPSPPVALSQIGVESPPKAKTTVAAQIEASVSEATADAPRKKVVKKVLKKEGAAGGEAPVPPPRKKEKKPKDK